MVENKESVNSDVTKRSYMDIFNNTIVNFIKGNQDPSACPSEIIRKGERKWKRLPKCKKLEFIKKYIKPASRCERAKYAPKKRKKCEPMCEELPKDMQDNMESDLLITESIENALMFDACCPKKRKKPNPCCPKPRKPRCPKKRKPRCPKKRKPRCRPKKRKPRCPRKKKRC